MPLPDGYIPGTTSTPVPQQRRTPKGSGNRFAEGNTGTPEALTIAELINSSTTPTMPAMPTPTRDINEILGITQSEAAENEVRGMLGLSSTEELLEAEAKKQRRDEKRDAMIERKLGEPPPAFINVMYPTQYGMMSSPTPNPALDEYNEKIDRLDRRKAQTTSLSSGERLEKHRPGDAQPMSWEEYNALTDRQRAAVDFNTLLVQAVRQDRRMNRLGKYDWPSEQAEKTYDKAVERMFGSDGGSKMYAPETLELLNQLKIEDQDADLDDFLKLRTVVTEDDLKYIPKPPGVNPEQTAKIVEDFTPAQEERWQQTHVLAGSTDAMLAQMAEANHLLSTIRQTGRAATYLGVKDSFGGKARMPEPGLGFGAAQFDEAGVPQDIHAYFQLKYEQMASKGSDLPLLFGDVEKTLKPEELEEFYRYLDIRTSAADRYRQDLGDERGVKYRSPEEFRAALGIDR